MNLLAENIKFLCIRQGIGQEELAIKAGVSKGTVSNVINERVKTRRTTLEQIAKALGMTVEQLMCESLSKGKCVENAARNIRIICMENGVTQAELALRCDVEEGTISKIINGKVQPRTFTLQMIANALETTPEELMKF